MQNIKILTEDVRLFGRAARSELQRTAKPRFANIFKTLSRLILAYDCTGVLDLICRILIICVLGIFDVVVRCFETFKSCGKLAVSLGKKFATFR
jgi:hypothetical protein